MVYFWIRLDRNLICIIEKLFWVVEIMGCCSFIERDKYIKLIKLKL